MSSTPETETPRDTDAEFQTHIAWLGGAIAGAIAAIATAIAITVLDFNTLRIVIAGLYGQTGSLTIGWIAHVVHGTLFGVIFAAILTDPGLYRLADSRWKTTLAGMVFGLVLAVIGAGIIMPIWLAFVGSPDPPRVPYVPSSSLFWHGIYGVTLGLVYPSVAPH